VISGSFDFYTTRVLAYLSLCVFAAGKVLALKNCEGAIHQELAEAFDSVALPVFDSHLQFLYGCCFFFPIHGVVCAAKNACGGFLANKQIGLALLVQVALLVQISKQKRVL
jgi:hypothetical protein